MLAEPTSAQRRVLGAIGYSRNVALLHTDTSLLPDAEQARASWNFRRPVEAGGHVTVTYDLTRLQRLPVDALHLVTLGGEDLVDPATVLDRMEYEHPLYARVGRGAAAAARYRLRPARLRRHLPRLGFHGDGARSGLAAAERSGSRGAAAGIGCWQPRTARHAEPTQRVVRVQAAGSRNPQPGSSDDDPAHPPGAVPPLVHPPLAHVAGRSRRPARPRAGWARSWARSWSQFGPRDHLGDRAARSGQRRCVPAPRGCRARRRPVLMAAPTRPGLLLQPDQRVLRCSGAGPAVRGRRGAQHLRRPARLPGAP